MHFWLKPCRRLISILPKDKSQFFIQQPLFYELKKDRQHEFILLINNSKAKVCIKYNDDFFDFEQDKSNVYYWKLKQRFQTSGIISLLVKFEGSEPYQILTQYQVVP
jgi:hypothetical protein